MNKDTVVALEAPFAKALIKTRPGSMGKKLSYVEVAEYIRRLNDVFDGCWEAEVVEHKVTATEVMVLLKLTVNPRTLESIHKTAFGGTSVTFTKQGEIISIVDDLKTAASDALKKAASLFGVGLHLYASEQERPKEKVAPKPDPVPFADSEQPPEPEPSAWHDAEPESTNSGASANQMTRLASLRDDPRVHPEGRKKLAGLVNSDITRASAGAIIAKVKDAIEGKTNVKYSPWEDLTPGEQKDQMGLVDAADGF